MRAMHTVWIFAALCGCTFEEKDIQDAARQAWSYTDESLRGAPYEPVRGKKPEIISSHEGVIFNGKPLRLGAPLREWLSVLGTPDAKNKDGSVMVWNDLGIRIFAPTEYFSLRRLPSGEPFVLEMSIYTQPPPPEVIADVPLEPDVEPAEKLEPAHVFPGYLQFDGFGMDARTTEQDIMRFNLRSEHPYRYHCINGARRRCNATKKLSSTLPPKGMREYVLFRVHFSFNEAEGNTVEDVVFGIDGHLMPSEMPEIEEF